MLKEVFNNIKTAFNKSDNALYQLILINIIVFVVMGILMVFSNFGGASIFNFVYNQLSIPAQFNEFILRPWTILTYAFMHSLGGIMHILFNMLVFFWFGQLIMEYLGSKKLVNLYVLGALAGGIIYLLAYNLVPYYIAQTPSGMVGASAAVFAVTVGAATLLPDYSFRLLLIGSVRIKYIAAVYVFLSFLGTVGSNAGGELAHLGGAFIGYIYIKQLQKGNDFGRFITMTINTVKGMFVKKSKIKVTHKKASFSKAKTTTTKTPPVSGETSQQEIDAILDKINESGYEKLTTEEKQKLFNAGK